MIDTELSHGSTGTTKATERTGERAEVLQTLTGYAASQGEAIGHCTVVARMEDLMKVREGAILVFETASPKLAFIIPRLSALVTARGGTLTAAAGYARECGVPAVVGVGAATETLHDGDLIRVDGTNGLVQLIAKKDLSS